MFPLFRDPQLYPHGSVNHKDSYLGKSGKPGKLAATPEPETPRFAGPKGKKARPRLAADAEITCLCVSPGG